MHVCLYTLFETREFVYEKYFLILHYTSYNNNNNKIYNIKENVRSE